MHNIYFHQKKKEEHQQKEMKNYEIRWNNVVYIVVMWAMFWALFSTDTAWNKAVIAVAILWVYSVFQGNN